MVFGMILRLKKLFKWTKVFHIILLTLFKLEIFAPTRVSEFTEYMYNIFMSY